MDMQLDAIKIFQPKQIKLELKTPLEQFWQALLVISLVAIPAGLLLHEESIPKMILYAGVVFLLVGGIGYLTTDNFYILSIEKKELLASYKVFFFRQLKTLAKFEDIHAITINGKENTQKGKGWWWEHQIVLALSSGKMLPISDFEKDRFNVLCKKIQQIADLTGAQIVPPEDEKVVQVKKADNGRYSFELKDSNAKAFLTVFAVACSFIALLIKLGFF